MLYHWYVFVFESGLGSIKLFITLQLTDGIVNSFRQSLTQMPVEQLKFLGKLSPTILNKDKDVDSLKFDFLLVLWERLEDSDKWGEKMRETKRHYADVIFNRS
jgi:hypothetical protein